MSVLLSFEGVSLLALLGQGRILNDISFAIAPGEWVAIVGPSGAGKSSLLKLANALKSPSTGVIYFQGKPIQTLSPVELRRKVVLAGQDVRLLGMTGQAALCYPLQLQGIDSHEQQVRMQHWVTLLGLPTEWLERTELELSGGQQQQLAIARALMLQPAILLLDEPTAAQDIGTATRLLTAIRQQTQERGMAVIMSNHQLDLAATFCDRLLYLEAGVLQQDAPATSVDWSAVRQRLVQVNTQAREEWDE